MVLMLNELYSKPYTFALVDTSDNTNSALLFGFGGRFLEEFPVSLLRYGKSVEVDIMSIITSKGNEVYEVMLQSGDTSSVLVLSCSFTDWLANIQVDSNVLEFCSREDAEYTQYLAVYPKGFLAQTVSIAKVAN